MISRVKWVFVLGSLLFVVFGLIACSSSNPSRDSDDDIGLECRENLVELPDRFYDGEWNFNQELVANGFVAFAAASYDSYVDRDRRNRSFYLADNDATSAGIQVVEETGWLFERRVTRMGGLVYDVYHRSSSARLEVLVAFRGTDQWLGADLIANASWVTRWFNPFDQYRTARADFHQITQAARSLADGRPLVLVVTGHSLGGGIAQHVAYSEPCVSAVVFNSSFVSLRPRNAEFEPRIVKIYEDDDPFEGLQHLVENNSQLSIYRLRLSIPPGIVFNHSMERLAAGMARMAVSCIDNTVGCEINDNATIPHVLYCQRYLGSRGRSDQVCTD